jgi:alanine or glycine:cation symporter, AGCS family
MNEVHAFLLDVKSIVWSMPMLGFLVLVGVYFTFLLRGVLFRYIIHSFSFLKSQDSDQKSGDISPFQSVMTTMSSAVGTGSIVGVATALMVGGLGAIFWLWVTTFVLMAVKYAENLLAMKYRMQDSSGAMCGGPMYYIEKGLGIKSLACLFALFASFAAIGTGNLVQVNAIASAMDTLFFVNPWITGALMTVVTGYVLFGGIKSIGKFSGWIVPVKAITYLAVGFLALLLHIDQIPQALVSIFQSAFSGQAATGGFLGASITMAIQMGVARSVFCSEAGLGISSIATAAARTRSSVGQAIASMSATMLSTAIICTVTALVIAVTGVLGQVDASGHPLNGAQLIIAAFSKALIGGKYLVVLGLVLFAYTTTISWAYYGEKCFEYLFGVKSVSFYRVLYVALIIPGSIFTLDVVWCFADIMNGLMIIPNMLALLGLASVVKKETDLFAASEQEALAEPIVSTEG